MEASRRICEPAKTHRRRACVSLGTEGHVRIQVSISIKEKGKVCGEEEEEDSR
jgi:hypothetical protein